MGDFFLNNIILRFGVGKVGAHGVAVCRCCAHLLSHWPLSLWWKLICYPGTQDTVTSECPQFTFAIIYFGIHLSTNPFGSRQEQLGELNIQIYPSQLTATRVYWA